MTTREIEPATPEQVRELVAEAAEVSEDLVVCLRVTAVIGARRGELVAPMWSDFVGERSTIRCSVVESDGMLIGWRTRTGSTGLRTIAVDADTLPAVDDLRERQAELAAEHELPEPVYVFSFDAGVTPLRSAACRSAGPVSTVCGTAAPLTSCRQACPWQR